MGLLPIEVVDRSVRDVVDYLAHVGGLVLLRAIQPLRAAIIAGGFDVHLVEREARQDGYGRSA